MGHGELCVSAVGAMPSPEPPFKHLQSHNLSRNDVKILEALAKWTSLARFEKVNAEKLELCVDTELPTKWATISRMEIVRQVCSHTHQKMANISKL